MSRMSFRLVGVFAPTILIIVFAGCAADAMSSDIAAAAYHPDTPFPEFMPLWREGWPWKDEHGEKMRYAYEGMPLGGYLFVHLRNPGPAPLQVSDVLLSGVSLCEGIAPQPGVKVTGEDRFPSSLLFSNLPRAQIDRLMTAGEPVWWKAEPMSIPPGGMGEVTVRLRRDPRVDRLRVGLSCDNGKTLETVVKTDEPQPRFFSINFSSGLDEVFAYLRHPSGTGIPPNRMLVDGKDVTAHCTIAADRAVNTVPVVIQLERPFEESTFHVFQAVYPDGSAATAGLRAWDLGMVYGAWGYATKGDCPEDVARRFLVDMAEHGINVHMGHSAGPGHEFMHTPQGVRLCESLGIRRMTHWFGNVPDPIFYFLTDEPDAADYSHDMIEPARRLGSSGQWLVERCKLFRRRDPATPILLNIDNTFKPENWYAYAKIADVPCADPYYQEAVQSVLSSDPTNLGPYVKPTYVYAVGQIYQSACAPNPMHLILHTCRFDFKPEEFPYRGPTPEEKRVEVYYALAAGAKGISFWWYTPFGRYYGAGGSDPDMVDMWTEVGLVGAEVRTASPIITRSCPAAVPVKAPRLLWVRSLLAGVDTLVIILVNDNMASDRMGTVVKPFKKARLSVQVPTWLQPRDVFEITYEGTQDITWQDSDSGIILDPGTIELTRLIIVSRDTTLRAQLQQRYDTQSASNVAKLIARR